MFVFSYFVFVLDLKWSTLFWAGIVRERMSKGGAMDLVSGLRGKLEKNDVLPAVEKYIYIFSLYQFFFPFSVYLFIM